MEPAVSAPPFDYVPDNLPRERTRHYISASAEELQSMMERIGIANLEELFAHLEPSVRMQPPLDLPEELPYDDIPQRLWEISRRNRPLLSFIGDGLPAWKAHPVAARVAAIRNLTTSYTPYQPERSQGTLITHWIYQCALSMLTGFEAINSSLYDRASGLYEAFCCALRLTRQTDTLLVSEGIYPGDLEVLRTLTSDTETRIETLAVNPKTGRLDPDAAAAAMENLGGALAAFAFPQVNSLGLLEDVDELTDICRARGIKSIALIDPMLLAADGLKPPSLFGAEGADMIVGEGQHLAIGPNFGGPGLGIFGVRSNEKQKQAIRQTPGRYVGKARDAEGRDCRVMILSTREQHIRKDKATSNICSNQAFLATMAGAALLARGDRGLAEGVAAAAGAARAFAGLVSRCAGLRLAFPHSPFFNEVTLELDQPVPQLLETARAADLHLGIDVSSRVSGQRNLLKLSFSDLHGPSEMKRLQEFLKTHFGQATESDGEVPKVPGVLLRSEPPGLPDFGEDTVVDYYRRLGRLNVGPEDTCYPLGSCTMKYNPYLNDWAANLPGFTDVHPQAPIADAQGCLQIIYETQEWFKVITGLDAVTTQPVAGAQGELVGIKMFQAFHRDRGESQRDVILIPNSAHGTNFATAVMAGYPTRKVDGQRSGIIYLEADDRGCIDLKHLEQVLEECRDRVAGIMITNPNTGGIFESNFRTIADLIHEDGGLVYMDGANMNAIAGWVDLKAMGVDAVHNNTHKTWTIPHGGGGPGDAFVAVRDTLADYLPGKQVLREADGTFAVATPARSIGSFHRHWGNFAHKIRCYAYLLRLGREGIRQMSAVAVLSSRYLHAILREHFPTLPARADDEPRMHEFIITLSDEEFQRIEQAGTPKAQAIPRIGKLFLDYGYHAPTVAFPEVYGLMIEPTESYRKDELDRFAETVIEIKKLIRQAPEVLKHVPYFTPISRVDEVAANRNPQTWEPLHRLPPVHRNRIDPRHLLEFPVQEISKKLKISAQAALRANSRAASPEEE